MKLEIIAEIHPQHGGDMGVAREMIREAKRNGADVAKFQLYDANALLGPEWAYLQLERDEVVALKVWCDQEGIEFMASVFDHERLGWCEELDVARYKIASGTVANDPELCQAVLDRGKETIVSLGHWHRPEPPFGESDRIHYLYCKAKYPAFYEDMGDFPDDFEAAGLAGYSDHTLGLALPLLAIARGARIIEKHMTLDKTQTKSTEKAHVCSMTPSEIATLRREGGTLFRARRAVESAGTARPDASAGSKSS